MLDKIKSIIVENIKLDFNKFKKEHHNEFSGYLPSVMYFTMFMMIIYYGGLIFLPLPIIVYFDAMLDKEKSNQKFVKIYNWIGWVTVISLMSYGAYLILING